jgi:hypothetical protein
MYDRNTPMNWYGEITVNTPSVDWGEVPLGLTFADADNNPETDISVTYIANGDYDQNINSSATWDYTGPPAESVTLREWSSDILPPDADGQFALKANVTPTLGSAIKVVNTPYGTIDTGSITSETGNVESTNALWLSLSETGIAPVTYTGEIHYQIANP